MAQSPLILPLKPKHIFAYNYGSDQGQPTGPLNVNNSFCLRIGTLSICLQRETAKHGRCAVLRRHDQAAGTSACF